MNRFLNSLLLGLASSLVSMPSYAQLAKLGLVWQGTSYKGLETFSVYIDADASAKPYRGELSWLDVAFAQAYGITYDVCNSNLLGYTKPHETQVAFHFYANRIRQRTHTLSCGKSRELASRYGLSSGRRVHYGSNFNPIVPTLELNEDWESKEFRRFRQSITGYTSEDYNSPTADSTPISRGRCENPNDLDSRGRRCGGRASSVRRGGR